MKIVKEDIFILNEDYELLTEELLNESKDWYEITPTNPSRYGVVYGVFDSDPETAKDTFNKILAGEYKGHEKYNKTLVSEIYPTYSQGYNITKMDTPPHRAAAPRVITQSDGNLRRTIKKGLNDGGIKNRFTSLNPVVGAAFNKVISPAEQTYTHHINGHELDNSGQNLFVFPYNDSEKKSLINMTHGLIHKIENTGVSPEEIMSGTPIQFLKGYVYDTNTGTCVLKTISITIS